MVSEKKVDNLTVRVYASRRAMGLAAAEVVAGKLKDLLQQKEKVNMIFAAAPSQNEFLEELTGRKNLEWNRVNAFHLDEYIGLDKNAPQLFGNFLKEKLFDKLPFAEIHYLNGNAVASDLECLNYSDLLKAYPADIVCLGIGENTHLAFNDPPVADFNDEFKVKVVELDHACRTQQVNDGCFATLNEVPTHALTLTIPTIMNAENIYCIVPGKNKAEAVAHTLNEDISETYPSTILRKHPRGILFLDKDSAALID